MLSRGFSRTRWTRRRLDRSVVGLVLSAVVVGSSWAAEPTIRIAEGSYEGAAHYVVTTPSATYHFDQAGGGLSRLIDREGKDWIAFRRLPWQEYPVSAESSFRGIPNFVHGSPDSGAGHPGHNECTSTKLSGNSILTTSRSGRWQWQWFFYADHASVTVLRSDPDHPYWFLYEGVPAGTYDPANQYFGTDAGGPRTQMPDYLQGEGIYEAWRWVYFGNRQTGRLLFVAQETADDLPDVYSCLGNSAAGLRSPDGMVVFGFGRSQEAAPLLTTPHTFYFGFLEQSVETPEDHVGAAAAIERIVGIRNPLPYP